MPVSRILDSTSFSGLDVAGQKAVRVLFDETYQSRKGLKLDHLQLFRKRKSLDVSLAYFGSKLNQTNEPRCFHRPKGDGSSGKMGLYAFYYPHLVPTVLILLSKSVCQFCSSPSGRLDE